MTLPLLIIILVQLILIYVTVRYCIKISKKYELSLVKTTAIIVIAFVFVGVVLRLVAILPAAFA